MNDIIINQTFVISKYAFSSFATGILALFLFIVSVIYYNYVEKDKVLLYTMSLEISMFLYMFSYGFGVSAMSDDKVVFWFKFMYIGITSLMVSSLFTADFLTRISYKKSKYLLATFGMLFIILIAYSDLILSDEVVRIFHDTPEKGRFFLGYVLYNFIGVVFILSVVIREVLYSYKHEKDKFSETWPIFLGLSLFLLHMMLSGVFSVYLQLFRARLSFNILIFALMIIIFFYKRIKKNITSKEKLFNEYVRDQITGLYTRNYFFELLKKDLKHNFNQNLLIGMIDMNKFKSINDRFGHLVGDEVLKQMGNLLNQMHEDVTVGRIGGDEFLLYSKHLKEGRLLDEIKKVMDAFKIYVDKREIDPDGIGVGISFGYSTYDRKMNYMDFSAACDEAMYLAKSKGNYCIEKKQ